ncbi:MAG: SLC13 family permease [Gammaproteobacteria bacterium]|nr:SLC13 family permease [Gammaproteobacteria bacterium]
MGWEAWFTLCVVTVCIGLLVYLRYAPDIILMSGLTLLLLSGVLSPQEALAGFANEGMVTVGVLYIVVTGLRETGGIAWISQTILGRPRSLPDAQFRLMLPVAAFSAFLNNTPVVAMFIPAVQDWARRHRLSVSRLMIPLSYAAIAGGTCTLIGTSTNLVVNGLIIKETGGEGLGMFELAWVGLPVVLLVVLATLLFSHWLPQRRSVLSQFADAREYTVEMLVVPGSPLEGMSIENAGLRQLPGMYLVEIDRENRILPAVSPHERLREDDRLVFTGIIDSVLDLYRINGLVPATDQVFKLDSPRHECCLVEAVVSDSFPLIGKSIRKGRFRTLYSAVVIAVARNGARISNKVGDIILQPGDTLLLETRQSFLEQHRNSRDFLLISRLVDFQLPRHERVWIAFGIIGLMVLSVTLGWLSMLQAAMLAAGLMIITRCTSGTIARRAVDWQVLVVIAASFGIGNALQITGAAHAVATSLIGGSAGSPWMVLSMIYLITALFSAVVTNNAAAVLMFPIALASANQLAVDFLPFAITVMIAASASFATPISYQTNLMVYGPGGYHFTDYLRLGLPLTLLVGLATILVVPLAWPL